MEETIGIGSDRSSDTSKTGNMVISIIIPKQGSGCIREELIFTTVLSGLTSLSGLRMPSNARELYSLDLFNKVSNCLVILRMVVLRTVVLRTVKEERKILNQLKKISRNKEMDRLTDPLKHPLLRKSPLKKAQIIKIKKTMVSIWVISVISVISEEMGMIFSTFSLEADNLVLFTKFHFWFF